MISRYEIIDVDFLRLPLPSNAPDRNPRVALGVLIDVGRGKEAKTLGRGVRRLGLGNAEAQPADPAHEAPIEKVRPHRNCERCTNVPFVCTNHTPLSRITPGKGGGSASLV